MSDEVGRGSSLVIDAPGEPFDGRTAVVTDVRGGLASYRVPHFVHPAARFHGRTCEMAGRVLLDEVVSGRFLWQGSLPRDEPPTAAVPAPARPAPAGLTPKAAAALEAKARGYTGNCCQRCSSTMMVMDGRCEKCLSCGESAGGCT